MVWADTVSSAVFEVVDIFPVLYLSYEQHVRSSMSSQSLAFEKEPSVSILIFPSNPDPASTDRIYYNTTFESLNDVSTILR
jgi:hypothetical protein